MLTLHPNILEKDGKKEFAVLPYEEFERLAEALVDFEDLKELRSAKNKEGTAPTEALSKIRVSLGI